MTEVHVWGVEQDKALTNNDTEGNLENLGSILFS